MRLLAARLRARFMLLFGMATALLFLSGAALADETPFDLESSSWMSFDRYKDKAANWLAPDQRTEAQRQPVIVPPPVMPASMPVLTAPTRPIITPVMPGLNKGFDVKVNSTEDNHLLPVIDADNQPVTGPQDNQWKDAVEAARQKDQTKKESDKDSSFSVRFSSLPAWTVPQKKAMTLATPAVKNTPAPVVKIAQPTVPAPSPVSAPPAVKAADAAACAALDAYKKRQLQAIESDRQTLTALQNAIAQLGLQKHLDFMPGAGGSLNMEAASSPNGSASKN